MIPSVSTNIPIALAGRSLVFSIVGAVEFPFMSSSPDQEIVFPTIAISSLAPPTPIA